MSLDDLLDAAYALAVERLERQALAALSAGAEVDVHEVIGQLDAELVAAPERSSLSPEQGLFRQSLGLR